MTPHYADQSRYMLGHTCPFARLMRYHLLGSGWVGPVPPEIAVGDAIHSILEAVLKGATAAGFTPTHSSISALVDPCLANGSYPIDSAPLAEISGLVHGWSRAVLPWLLKNYEVLSTEQEQTLDLGYGLVWMARPDIVLRRRADQKLVVADFKSTRSKPDRAARIHETSLQQIMNCYSVAQRYGEPVEEVQVHILAIGTEAWPTPITHAYYRPANLPYVQEDWQPRSRRPDGTWLGKLYRRVPVHERRPIAEWVWSMPPDPLRETVPVSVRALDSEVEGLKVLEAINSIIKNETNWKSLLDSIDWKTVTWAELARLVPRTFTCVQYDRSCEYTRVCFDPNIYNSAPDDSFLANNGFYRRVTHHPQEK